jgi:hypothetical protein
MYYGLGTLNVCTPIIWVAYVVSNPVFARWFWMATAILWIITAVVMVVALLILTRYLDVEARAAVNCKEVSLHIIAFTTFGVCCTCLGIFDLLIKVIPDFEVMTK